MLSFVASLYLTGTRPPIAFFGLPTRAWQLALGALVAVFAARVGWVRAAWRAVVGWVGLAALVCSLGSRHRRRRLPGLGGGAAHPRRRGPCSRPAAATSRGTGRSRLLGRFGLPGVGRLSYSWYLWHWPPLVLVPAALGRPLTAPQAVAICVLSLGLAYLSYRWIEQPARFARVRWCPRPRLSLAGGGLLSVAPAVCWP